MDVLETLNPRSASSLSLTKWFFIKNSIFLVGGQEKSNFYKRYLFGRSNLMIEMNEFFTNLVRWINFTVRILYQLKSWVFNQVQFLLKIMNQFQFVQFLIFQLHLSDFLILFWDQGTSLLLTFQIQDFLFKYLMHNNNNPMVIS